MSDHVLDPSVIENLRQLTLEGEPDLASEVLTLFRNGAAVRMAAIAGACRADDAVALQRRVHEFKGAAAAIGAFALQRCCHELELAGKNGTLDDHGSALLAALEAEYARVDAAIAKLI
jgi:HPt (histidine-containing phosphotransfer) domain-containing protein